MLSVSISCNSVLLAPQKRPCAARIYNLVCQRLALAQVQLRRSIRWNLLGIGHDMMWLTISITQHMLKSSVQHQYNRPNLTQYIGLINKRSLDAVFRNGMERHLKIGATLFVFSSNSTHKPSSAHCRTKPIVFSMPPFFLLSRWTHEPFFHKLEM